MTKRAFFGLSALIAPLLLLAGTTSPAIGADRAPTTTTVSAPATATYGEPFTVVVTVTAATGVPSGTVHLVRSGFGPSIYDLGTHPVSTDGTVTVTVDDALAVPIYFRADFVGADGFADSSGTAQTEVRPAPVVVRPEPTILEISRSNPLKVTLVLSAHLTTANGRPLAGELLRFYGPKPKLAEPGNVEIVCSATTNAQGYATCGGSSTVSAIVSLLSGGTLVVHPEHLFYYAYGSATAQPVVIGGP